ncbi:MULTISPECIES: HlyD family type I secretion periplasmic adaptor subunit [Bradyrhizobium]|jgi:HlyD family secretion protein|uniref:Membrane fusion protein (MFP) family protein n=6 Tax=Bradyrhizobium TaxID=374 RepID=A0ABS5GHQ3_9BRAD|nr:MULTISPECIES: HlyD family type I secretion periplasmic adaptor subunit [Bradyrhizobium]MBR1140872.1 HlyD family type I secretion periplasmic adaptor subunit [Bradyrhizobium denitrificans]MDU1497143.1 HlyD family type I secretion periplasmic adaptor subunit [Bradyrhizobium sp.]MDU1547290.1 HlyD family type I secretion periplasmic adaptor subunit [Bradyrhizobium sp.]MDU2926214.1 HlyD family type I secretion periplasmic adaptor subunit [Bradyrhizobium sp.]MDU3042327.1 HlyD family type I secret
MKHINDFRPFDDEDYVRPKTRAVGPQGDALILELQRLQGAFDEGSDADPRDNRGSRKKRRAPPSAVRNKSPRTKKRPGKMGRALGASLSLLGFRSATARPQRASGIREMEWQDQAQGQLQGQVHGHAPAMRSREPEFSPPPRQQQTRPPTNDAALLDLRNANRDGNVGGGALRAMPQHNVPARVDHAYAVPQTRVGRIVGTAGTALTTGMTFIAAQGTAAALDDPSDEPLVPRVGRMFENELRLGLRVLLVAAVLGGGWLTLVPLAGAIVVPGNLVVQSNVKAIQHPTGGIIAEIKVDNGKRVTAGDLLVRLDATQSQAQLQAITKQLNEQRAKIARLSAERDGLDQPEYPTSLTSRPDDAHVRAVIASENALFKARATTRKSQKELLQGRIVQLNNEISGMESQLDSKNKQIELIKGELAGVQELYDKRLVPLTRLTTLQREAARIDGERGQLVSSVAETRSKISEAELQTVKIDQDFRSEVVKDLGDAQAKEGDLVEKGVAARDQLDRIEMRAPNSGTIHQLAVHTIGGVIKPGETIMELVPDSDELQVEAHVQPKDIDHVHTGQNAMVRFNAFNQRTTPQLSGQVSFVAPDITNDPRSGSTFYTVRITLSEEERQRLGGVNLMPGMQAEVYVQTGSRTMLSYLMKPITDQWRRAFVEQ